MVPQCSKRILTMKPHKATFQKSYRLDSSFYPCESHRTSVVLSVCSTLKCSLMDHFVSDVLAAQQTNSATSFGCSRKAVDKRLQFMDQSVSSCPCLGLNHALIYVRILASSNGFYLIIYRFLVSNSLCVAYMMTDNYST